MEATTGVLTIRCQPDISLTSFQTLPKVEDVASDGQCLGMELSCGTLTPLWKVL